MGVTEQDLQPLKKVKIPAEYENDAQFYQETIQRQHEKRRLKLLAEYNELLNNKQTETPSAPKSLPPDEKSEDTSHSRIYEKLQKMKNLQLEQRKQQLIQYSQKEQLIESRRNKITSERELRLYQKEVLETTRMEQVQRNKQVLQKLTNDKYQQRRMSYDARLQKWELYRQAQYLQPRSSRVDETLARYQKSVEDRRQLDQLRLKRLEESLEKAQSKKSQNMIEVKRRGLVEQLKIEEALFNRERALFARKNKLLDRFQLRTESLRPTKSELPKQKPYPQPKFLYSKQQRKLNSQSLELFCQDIVNLVETANIHEIEDKLLQLCATQDRIQKDLYSKTNFLFLYN